MDINEKKKSRKDGIISLQRTPGEIVVARRKELKWTQEELAWNSKISVTQLSRIENDKAKPGFETIEKLEKALGIKLLDVFMKFRKYLDPEKKSYLSTKDALREFERKLAKTGISEEELQDVLEKVLSEAESKDENT